MSIEISKLLQDLLPYMEELSERFPDGVLREQSADLRICIATCGAVWSDLLTTATTPDKTADCNDDTNVLHRDKVLIQHTYTHWIENCINLHSQLS